MKKFLKESLEKAVKDLPAIFMFASISWFFLYVLEFNFEAIVVCGVMLILYKVDKNN